MTYLMKGKVWDEHKHKLVYPIVGEVKYDEIRLHLQLVFGGVNFLSYAGKPHSNMQEWHDFFYRWMSAYGIANLDMGIEVNHNFNDSYRWTRSSKGIPKEKFDKVSGKTHPALDSSMVRFILFDLPDSLQPYYDRRHTIREYAYDMSAHGLPVTVAEGKLLYTESEVEEYFLEVRARGLEGLMGKTLDHKYEQGKRIDGWLKVKPEETFDGKITGINQAFALDGTPHDRAGSITVVLEDGSTADPAGIEWGLARAMWEAPDRYIGRWLEFKCMERDRNGGYRHPCFVRLREDKQ